ncbi:MAG TPA: helix-turn-helix transcriptional regulator [Mollicutes bacterium]|jgi:putative transcriptional regulator|nr:helix-turn-helix transcriptional regulator [Mollicutes bacterium]
MYSKLRKIRNNNQYTVQQMADMLGISKSFYSQLETRNRRLFYDMAVKIATIFNMRPDEIFYDDHINNKKEKTN